MLVGVAVAVGGGVVAVGVAVGGADVGVLVGGSLLGGGGWLGCSPPLAGARVGVAAFGVAVAEGSAVGVDGGGALKSMYASGFSGASFQRTSRCKNPVTCPSTDSRALTRWPGRAVIFVICAYTVRHDPPQSTTTKSP